MTPDTLGFKAFAEHIGCRPSYVTELKKAGRLVLTDDGRAVRVADSIARIDATRDPSRAAVADRHAAERGAPLTTSGSDPAAPGGEGAAANDPADDDDPDPKFQHWKARRERAAALREEIKLGEESKDYLRRADAAAVVGNAFVMLRTSLEALPDSMAPTLAGESDENRVRILLAEEIEHILGNCSAELAKLNQTKG